MKITPDYLKYFNSLEVLAEGQIVSKCVEFNSDNKTLTVILTGDDGRPVLNHEKTAVITIQLRPKEASCYADGFKFPLAWW